MSWKHLTVAVGVAAGLAACGGSGKGNLSVSAANAGAPAGGPSATATSLDLGNGLSIDQIKVVVRKLELEGPTASCTPAPAAAAPAQKNGADDPVGGSGGGSGGSGRGGADDPANHDQGDDHGDDEACEIEAGPFLVSLSASDLVSGIHPAFDASIPTGTFREISVRIDTINAEKAARAPIESQRAALADMAARHVSLEITGTKDGQPFDLAVPIDVRIKWEGSITISPDTVMNLTLPMDVSSWFDSAGAVLDPSNPAEAAQILQNLLSSLRIVHDDDHDGRDDHGGHGNDDGPGHT